MTRPRKGRSRTYTKLLPTIVEEWRDEESSCSSCWPQRSFLQFAGLFARKSSVLEGDAFRNLTHTHELKLGGQAKEGKGGTPRG